MRDDLGGVIWAAIVLATSAFILAVVGFNNRANDAASDIDQIQEAFCRAVAVVEYTGPDTFNLDLNADYAACLQDNFRRQPEVTS